MHLRSVIKIPLSSLPVLKEIQISKKKQIAIIASHSFLIKN